MFELQYEPLILSETMRPWEIAFIPWDSETFGYGVAALSPCNDEKGAYKAGLLEKALTDYSKDKQVSLITASIPADEYSVSLLLQQAGFCFIDLSLRVLYENFNIDSVSNRPMLSVVPATPEEVDVVVEMAGGSFQHGRYHQDISIERSLADQRYRDWVRRCLDPENPQEILVVKFEDSICGFSIVERKENHGYLHLHAIDSKWRGRKFGAEMVMQSINYLHNLGVESIGTRISASNLKTLNMHSRLKGQFTAADLLLHWHSKGDNGGVIE